MRTNSLAAELSAHVAIKTESLQFFGEIVSNDPTIKLERTSSVFLTVLSAATIYMVNRKEVEILFSAALTFSTIGNKNLVEKIGQFFLVAFTLSSIKFLTILVVPRANSSSMFF